ncbi:hypothetical protein [Pseudonocardia spirodelae]|uniref:Secreted protein n=1 Tax=Pseudonocardia spirodelae TaxID=3133431 RepID=A0ABU8T2U5_9PSEU
MTSHRRPRRSVSRALLAGLVPAAAAAALCVASVASAEPVVAVAAPAPAGPGVVAREFPAPLVPGVVPDVPLSSFVEDEPEPVLYTCEPTADPEFEDPAHPHYITNKNCPDLIAAKERAQREYLEQLQAEERDAGGDGLESACSDPTSGYYGTAACGSDLDGDGIMDGFTG